MDWWWFNILISIIWWLLANNLQTINFACSCKQLLNFIYNEKFKCIVHSSLDQYSIIKQSPDYKILIEQSTFKISKRLQRNFIKLQAYYEITNEHNRWKAFRAKKIQHIWFKPNCIFWAWLLARATSIVTQSRENCSKSHIRQNQTNATSI